MTLILYYLIFESIIRIFTIYEDFKEASGATLNEAKTKISLMGNAKIDNVSNEYKTFVTEQLKIYGFLISRDGLEIEDNWEEVKNTVSSLATTIPHKEMSYYAKINVVQTYFLSKMWYLSSIITPASGMYKSIEKSIDAYLWYPTKTNVINKLILKRSREQGGIAYPDVYMKILAFRLMLLIRRFKAQQKAVWHDTFDFFYDRVKNVAARNLDQVKVPPLYREIRKAELQSSFLLLENNVGFGLGAKIFSWKHVKTKILYEHMIEKKVGKATTAIETYWKYRLDTRNIDFSGYFRLNRTKYVDGYTRSIHYALFYRALYTNSKLSNFTDVQPYCKHCLALQELEQEDVYHVFIDCGRVEEFWPNVEKVLQKIDASFTLSNENKLFGLIGPRNSNKFLIANFIVQSAQRVIWTARKKYEDKELKIDLWDALQTRLYVLIKRLEICNNQRFVDIFSKSSLVVYTGKNWKVKI